MSFMLKNVVPWGRSFDEYVAMFALTDNDLRMRICGCGDGPASFNALLTQQGGQIISVDPLYRFSAEKIRRHIKQTYATVMEQTRNNQHEFTWTSIKSVDELGAKTSRHLHTVIDRLTVKGYVVTIGPVLYEFQRGGNHMMRVKRRCV